MNTPQPNAELDKVPMNSDTPRTDIVVTSHIPNNDEQFLRFIERINKLERENNQLHAALKQCAEALENQLCLENMEHIRVELKAILALPSVQNALKEK